MKRRKVRIPAQLPPEPETQLRNIYGTRLVIRAERTPSGTRYDFGVNEVKPVKAVDLEYLKGLKRHQNNSCCGGSATADIPYFEEA